MRTNLRARTALLNFPAICGVECPWVYVSRSRWASVGCRPESCCYKPTTYTCIDCHRKSRLNQQIISMRTDLSWMCKYVTRAVGEGTVCDRYISAERKKYQFSEPCVGRFVYKEIGIHGQWRNHVARACVPHQHHLHTHRTQTQTDVNSK